MKKKEIVSGIEIHLAGVELCMHTLKHECLRGELDKTQYTFVESVRSELDMLSGELQTLSENIC